jgi:hypothetical protein
VPCKSALPAPERRPRPIADRSRRAYRIGAEASQSDAKFLYKLAKTIKSFRFLSRVLDSRPK